jgi:hypothetical protein
MPKKSSATTETAQGAGMTTELVGGAVAIGQDTYASVTAISSVVDHGEKVTARALLNATAAAESPNGDTQFAAADTSAEVFGADRVSIKTVNRSYESDGVAYETSVSKIKALDYGRTERTIQREVHKEIDITDGVKTVTKTKEISIEKNGESFFVTKSTTSISNVDGCDDDVRDDITIDLDGNVSTIDFDAQAIAENTFVTVDAYALSVEDQLSEVAVMITSAVS